jgi:hypothetical protein
LLAIFLTTVLIRFEGQSRLQLKAPVEEVQQLVSFTIMTYLRFYTTLPISDVLGTKSSC